MKKWGSLMSGMGTAALTLLSCATCPLCLPLYLGLLNLVGIEFMGFHEYFFSFMVFGILFTLGITAYQIRRYHGSINPLILASLFGFFIILGIESDSEYLIYSSLIGFLCALFWHKFSIHNHSVHSHAHT